MMPRWLSTWLGKRPVIDAQAAASALSRHGHNKARAKIRAKCDEMAAELGWPLPEWRDL